MSRVMGAIDKACVRQSFAVAAQHYDAMAGLQRQIGSDLLTQWILPRCEHLPQQIFLDVGCGTGFLTALLQQHLAPQHLIGLDIALSMLQMSRDKLAGSGAVHYLCADAECVPLASQSIDVVVSNLALQWCLNLNAVFTDFKRLLTTDGQLIFTTFGTQTLQELKQAWASVDEYRHVNDFYSAEQIRFFLHQAGFSEIAIATQTYTLPYPSVMELMQELKGIGAQNRLTERKKGMTSKNKLQAMIKAYQAQFADSSIAATYAVIFVAAKV